MLEHKTEPAAAARVGPVRGTTKLSLTPRERQVAALIARGYSNRQIADELVISRGTAENHVAHILAKLGCRNRTEVAVSCLAPDGAQEYSPPATPGTEHD